MTVTPTEWSPEKLHSRYQASARGKASFFTFQVLSPKWRNVHSARLRNDHDTSDHLLSKKMFWPQVTVSAGAVEDALDSGHLRA